MAKKFDPSPYRSKMGKKEGRSFDPAPYKSKITLFKDADLMPKYREAAYRALGLPYQRRQDKIYHYLGDIDLTSSAEAMTAIVQANLSIREEAINVYSYTEYLDAYHRRGRIVSQIEACERYIEEEHLRQDEHGHKVAEWEGKDIEKRGPEPTYREKVPPKVPEKRDIIFANNFTLETFTPDVSGYANYLMNVDPIVFNIIRQPLPLHIEDNPDRPHGYVLGTTGSGKSELLKLLVHTYVTNKQYGSVVVIDPTSDFAGQMAKWKEFNTTERLIYVRPTLARGKSPCINPFEIHGIEASDYSEEALNIKRVIAQELVEALGRIVTEGGGFLTPPMRTILTNCVLVLLDKEGSTLEDLSDFMKDTENEKLIAFATTLKHHEYIARYFTTTEGGFGAGTNKITKEAIGRRMDDLLSVGTFRKVTCGKSTIDIEDQINRKKVILFDLGKGAIGKKEGAALGRLVIAMLIGIAFRREAMKMSERVPCSIVIDECHNFVSETMEEILTEARKYRLLLTMAQQIAGQRMLPKMKDIVLETTNLQIVGGTSASGAKRNAEIVGVDPDDIRQLHVGEFFIRASRFGLPVKFKARSELLDWRNSVTAPSWKRQIQNQIEKYYTPVEARETDSYTEEDGDYTTDGAEWTIETS